MQLPTTFTSIIRLILMMDIKKRMNQKKTRKYLKNRPKFNKMFGPE